MSLFCPLPAAHAVRLKQSSERTGAQRHTRKDTNYSCTVGHIYVQMCIYIYIYGDFASDFCSMLLGNKDTFGGPRMDSMAGRKSSQEYMASSVSMVCRVLSVMTGDLALCRVIPMDCYPRKDT